MSVAISATLPKAARPPVGRICYKIATERWEEDAIHELNHATFAGEIPQHAPNADGRLVDKFHEENTYLIAVRGRTVLGMIALRDRRPFSLDTKVPNLDAHLPAGLKWCEIRLLAVRPSVRGGLGIAAGLMTAVCRLTDERGWEAFVISGTTRQQQLYQKLGFRPFGGLVGTAEAPFQPMYGLQEELRSNLPRLAEVATESCNMLPGPVPMRCETFLEFRKPLGSHRSRQFLQDFAELRELLCALTSAPHVAVLTGTGTLANSIVAMEIAKAARPGVILTCGEFGKRLVELAKAAGLSFVEVLFSRGEAPDWEALAEALPAGASWLWTTHCETSCGTLLALADLKHFCRNHQLRLCLDAVSTLGSVPLDLTNVWLASGSSGKGLAAPCGLAMVFHEEAALPGTGAPWELHTYTVADGVPNTINTCLVRALLASLRTTPWSEKQLKAKQVMQTLAEQLEDLGWYPLASQERHPGILTYDLGTAAAPLGAALRAAGVWVSFESRHLQTNGWIQFCLLGHLSAELENHVLRLPGTLVTLLAGRPAPA